MPRVARSIVAGETRCSPISYAQTMGVGQLDWRSKTSSSAELFWFPQLALGTRRVDALFLFGWFETGLRQMLAAHKN